MKLSHFVVLEHEEKKTIVLHFGTLIGKRKAGDLLIFLFQLDSFYVEAYSNPVDKVMLEFIAFEGTAPLQPYLERIPIDHLFKA